MRKLITLTTALLFFFTAQSQVIFSSNFENWTGQNPDGWKGSKTNFAADSIIQISSGALNGTNAVKLVNSTTSHKRFTTQPLAVVNGQNYEVKFWAKGKGDIRVGLFDSSAVSSTSGYHYEAYNNVNTATWTQYTQNIVADTSYSTAQFILSVRSTALANDHLWLDSVVISIPAPAGPSSIYDIQYTTLPSGDSPLNSQAVNTGGIVTAIYASGYFIQDNPGAWNGIHVFDNVNTPAIGDSVTLSAFVTEFFNMTQLTSVSNFVVVNSGNPLPAVAQISTSDVNTEAYEGVFVKVTNATCVNANAGFGMWTVNDGSADCKIHDLIFAYTPTQGNVYSVQGPTYYSFAEFRILPREANDVQTTGFNAIGDLDQLAVQIYPNPVSDNFTIAGDFSTAELSLFDASGRLVLTKTINSENQQISTSELNPGFYIVLVKTNGSFSSTKIQKI